MEYSGCEELKIEKFHLPVPSYTVIRELLSHFHFLKSLDPVTDQICLFFPLVVHLNYFYEP